MHEPTVRAEPPLTATSTFPRELTATVDTDSSTKTASTSTTSSQDALPLASFPALVKLVHLLFSFSRETEADVRTSYNQEIQAGAAEELKRIRGKLDSAIDAEEKRTMSTRTAGGTTTVTTSKIAGSATQTATSVGTETLNLRGFAEAVAKTLRELKPAEIKSLSWSGPHPFAEAPWLQYPGTVAIFVSKQMDAYVEEALKHKVKGKGMGMTQGELLAQIREATGVMSW